MGVYLLHDVSISWIDGRVHFCVQVVVIYPKHSRVVAIKVLGVVVSQCGLISCLLQEADLSSDKE